ncbi:MAG TPA: phosphotransferase [Gemmatimonadota bacterium]|nr:phosphotransferase [Gemmatimonadota bacterium]
MAPPLDAWTIAPYLAARGLLTFEETAFFPPRATLRAGRSLVFRVEGRPLGRIVKQALDEQTRQDQRREASIYQFLESTCTGRVPAPRLIHDDAARAVLVLEDLRLHRSLSSLGRPTEIPAATWEALGNVLGALHRQRAPRLAADPPWIVSLDRPGPSLLRVAGEGQVRLVARIQQSATWRHGLAALRFRWRPTVATHGDLRLDNVLVDPTNDSPDVRLVDWELAGPGDPAADLGWIVGDLLARVMDLGEEPASVVAATRALWLGYAHDRTRAERSRLCDDVPRWAAARLLLAAYEKLEGPMRLEPTTARWLDCAEDALAHPRAFGRAMLGESGT